VSEKDKDEEMLDEDEDIGVAKATQASLDDAKAKKTADDLKSLQKLMGVARDDAQASATADSDDDYMATNEPEEPEEPEEGDDDNENDVAMTEADGDNERW
jgi:hypothetical protein